MSEQDAKQRYRAALARNAVHASELLRRSLMLHTAYKTSGLRGVVITALLIIPLSVFGLGMARLQQLLTKSWDS